MPEFPRRLAIASVENDIKTCRGYAKSAWMLASIDGFRAVITNGSSGSAAYGSLTRDTFPDHPAAGSQRPRRQLGGIE